MRPRILLIPTLTELEWAVRPRLEEWAEVATYDGPGIGDEPPSQGFRSEATARRGLAELDDRGWDRCVVAGDELGSLAAMVLARARPEAVQALVLGHPIVSFDITGERRTFNQAVIDAHVQLADTSHRAFVREQFRAWLGLYGQPAEQADVLAEAFLARVPHTAATGFYAELLDNRETYAAGILDALVELRKVPTLLIHHDGCLMYTREGFEDAAAALPGAETAATRNKPSVDPAFADILREFLERLEG